ncbi:MAG: HD-GYP domain-containing protein [Negativicutes bacterium]|nr:HD-GYP domain-containing protein [Negativicutes bacterium]
MTHEKKSARTLIEQVNMDAIEAFCKQIYFCDSYTAMHAEHVAELMAGLASQMSFTSDEINLAHMVGVMHDVGKIKIPASILNKPGPLTEEEWKVMKQHPVEGACMLAAVGGVEPIVPVMRHHHERFDGTGYPDGLKGQAIPLFSRMLAVCDAFDAMTTERCYRTPVSLEQCLSEIRRCGGTQFDAALCESFIEFIAARFGFCLLDEEPGQK